MRDKLDIWALVKSRSRAEISQLQDRFVNAMPYSHLVIDDFFEADFLASLQREFPVKSEEYDRFCIEDGGAIGTNYANGQVETFPPAFKQLDALIKSKSFLDYIQELTGIEKLQYDPEYFGGGLRESRSGTFLPPHLDFNHHPASFTYRRLNLLFYFNPEWREEWGGNFQVHRDPTKFRGTSAVYSYTPLNNRCLIFETSEISWHGFDRLNLSEGRSRRAFTLYYYTEHRPNEESVKFHNTEYVEPPLPPHFTAGHTLSEADVALLNEYIARRDNRIRLLYDLRADLDAKVRHVWEQYEYYLNLSKSKSTVNSLMIACQRAVGNLKRTLRSRRKESLTSVSTKR